MIISYGWPLCGLGSKGSEEKSVMVAASRQYIASFLGKEPSAACGGSAAYGSKNLHNRACGPLEIHPYPRLRRYFS